MGGSARARTKGSADPTHYPVDDGIGEGLLHRLIGERLRALIERWLARKGRRALVGANQYIYYEQYNPKGCVAPDVYVLEGVDPRTEITSWKIWERGVIPSLAVEIVSEQPQKDYHDVLTRYERLGVPEVIVFDPKEGRDRIRWQVYRRARGELRQVAVSDGDRVRSRALRGWLRAVGEGSDLRVRIGMGLRGDELLPTESEEERARAEEERARAEEEHARAEEEHARAEAAEREVAKLRAELERLRGKR